MGNLPDFIIKHIIIKIKENKCFFIMVEDNRKIIEAESWIIKYNIVGFMFSLFFFNSLVIIPHITKEFISINTHNITQEEEEIPRRVETIINHIIPLVFFNLEKIMFLL